MHVVGSQSDTLNPVLGGFESPYCASLLRDRPDENISLPSMDKQKTRGRRGVRRVGSVRTK